MAEDIDDDEPLEDRLERIQRRAENLRELLKDGDEILVTLEDGELSVGEVHRSRLEREHPKLFGRMLAIEEQMRTGAFPYFVGLIAFTVFLVGLQLDWWTSVLGEGLVDILNRWWFYIVAPLSILYLIYLLCSQWGKYVFVRNCRALLDLIKAEGLDPDVLVVTLRDEGELENLLYFLKLHVE